jgi:hypothetical protein
MIVIYNRRTSIEKIRQQHPQASIFDVTSRGSEPWIRFSPFYPHKAIPVPFSADWTSASVEGIWQGLKVFEQADVDPSKFGITNMKGIKRSARTYGKVLGHRKGVTGEQLLPYLEARHLIYLPTYRWILEHYVQGLLAELKQIEKDRTIVLLDYETNCDVSVLTKPLSHAGLIKLYLEEK